jgi:hypothetical protein
MILRALTHGGQDMQRGVPEERDDLQRMPHGEVLGGGGGDRLCGVHDQAEPEQLLHREGRQHAEHVQHMPVVSVFSDTPVRERRVIDDPFETGTATRATR